MARLRSVALELLPAVIVGAIVMVAVAAYGMTRPNIYEARSTLVAAPRDAAAVNANFPGLVNLALPGVDELVHTDSVLNRTHQAIPQSTPPDELTGQVAVSLVPASGVVRISVRQADPEAASQVVQALAKEVEASSLLDPLGQFRTLDDSAPVATKVSPDPRLAIGSAAAAGAIAALLVLLIGRRIVTIPSRMAPLFRTRGIPFVDTREGFHIVADVVPTVQAMRLIPLGRVNQARVEWVRETMGAERLAEGMNAPVCFLVSDGSTSRRDIQQALDVFERRRVPVVCALLV